MMSSVEYYGNYYHIIIVGRWTGVPTDPNVFYYQDLVAYNQQYNHIGMFS